MNLSVFFKPSKGALFHECVRSRLKQLENTLKKGSEKESISVLSEYSLPVSRRIVEIISFGSEDGLGPLSTIYSEHIPDHYTQHQGRPNNISGTIPSSLQ